MRLRTATVLGLGLVLGCGGGAPPEKPTSKGPAPKPIVPTRPEVAKPAEATESIVPPPPKAVLKEKAKEQTEPAPTAAPKEAAKQNEHAGTQSVPKKTGEPAAPPKPGTAATAAVTLKTVDLAGYAAAIASHKGKLVAVDAWATWCIPCVKKFPHFVELARKHGKGDIVFVTLSVDDAENKGEALEFLTKHDARFVNLLVTDGLAPLQEKLEFEGVPQYFLYDRTGKLVLRADDVEKLAAALAEF